MEKDADALTTNMNRQQRSNKTPISRIPPPPPKPAAQRMIAAIIYYGGWYSLSIGFGVLLWFVTRPLIPSVMRLFKLLPASPLPTPSIEQPKPESEQPDSMSPPPSGIRFEGKSSPLPNRLT